MFWGTSQERRAIDHFRYHQLQCAAGKNSQNIRRKTSQQQKQADRIQIRKITIENHSEWGNGLEKYPAINRMANITFLFFQEKMLTSVFLFEIQG